MDQDDPETVVGVVIEVDVIQYKRPLQTDTALDPRAVVSQRRHQYRPKYTHSQDLATNPISLINSTNYVNVLQKLTEKFRRKYYIRN